MTQRTFFLVIASIVVFLVDLYVFQAIRTVTQGLSVWAQRTIYVVYWALTVITIVTLLLVAFTRGTPPNAFKMYWASFFFILFASKLIVVLFLFIDDAIRFVKLLTTFISPKTAPENSLTPGINRNEFLNKLALFAGAIPLTAFVYGMVRGAFAYQVKKVVLKFPNLPEGFNGFRMLQITDLHTGSFASGEPLKKAVNLINKQNADIVFFTGDLVNSIATEVEPYIDILGSIKGKMGVYSVLGNHDYGDYVNWETREAKLANLNRLKTNQKKMNWRLLVNEHVELERNGDKIALIGVENWGGRVGFPKYGRMDIATASVQKYPFKVLLSHDPSHWDGEVNLLYPDIDLMLSGHTHGMQFGINIPGLKWSPAQYVYRQWAGLYKKGKQYLYVNVGLGFLGYPGRVGFLPEITVFELQKA